LIIEAATEILKGKSLLLIFGEIGPDYFLGDMFPVS
jgi:hypothetical protein